MSHLAVDKSCCRRLLGLGLAALLMAAVLASAVPAWTQAQDPPKQEPQQQVPGAGGPQGDVGPYSIPRKKTETPPETPKPKPPKNPPEIGSYSISKTVDLVNVDVMVVTKDGQSVPGLKKDYFRVLEDGVPQNITAFNTSAEAPITAVLLIEFANTNYNFMIDALNASYSFTDMLKKDDWVAVVYYDLKPHMLTDFTQDKRQVIGALNQLRIPGFSETNLFDALYDTLDRLEGVDGRKYVILVTSGRDTFSKLTYDKILKRVSASRNVSIYAVSTGRAFREWVDTHYGMNPDVQVGLMDYLQADNALKTFAKMTGGQAYFPRFFGEFGEIYRDIGASIRNQYILSYHSTNQKRDGGFRKLKVEVIDPRTGKPLVIADQKGKPLKYNIIARDGYTAKNVVD